MSSLTDRPAGAKRGPGVFDRLADRVAVVTARAGFFAACVALVVIWLPSLLVVPNFDTWQLLINTPTTILTFLLVGLSRNISAREDIAIQKKLDATAAALVLLLDVLGHGESQQADTLRDAVKLEKDVGT